MTNSAQLQLVVLRIIKHEHVMDSGGDFVLASRGHHLDFVWIPHELLLLLSFSTTSTPQTISSYEY